MNTKSHRNKDTLRTPLDNEVVIGKIYAEWCSHCKNMGDGFKQVGDIVISKYNSDADASAAVSHKRSSFSVAAHKRSSSGAIKGGKNIILLEIEEEEKDEKLDELNKRYFGGSDKIKCDGYPTIFIISGGNIEYYKGETNFTDREGKDNMMLLQKWMEHNIDNNASQNGGGSKFTGDRSKAEIVGKLKFTGGKCGCAAGRQSGGWRAKNKKNASQTRSRSRSKSRRSRTKSRRS